MQDHDWVLPIAVARITALLKACLSWWIRVENLAERVPALRGIVVRVAPLHDTSSWHRVEEELLADVATGGGTIDDRAPMVAHGTSSNDCGGMAILEYVCKKLVGSEHGLRRSTISLHSDCVECLRGERQIRVDCLRGESFV